MNAQPTEAQPSDEELVREIWKGDATSFAILFERYRVPLYISALHMLGSRQEAEDAVQETFLIALRKLERVIEPGAVKSWLHQVIRNVCLMQLRSAQRTVANDAWLLHSSWSTIEDTVEAQIERLALQEWVWAALNRLPATLRMTAILRYFSRTNSYDAVATVLGVPIGTVRSRLHQVKVELAETLLEDAGLPDGETMARWRAHELQYDTACQAMNQRTSCDAYMATLADDLQLILPDGSVSDRHFWQADAEEIMRAGVKIHLNNVMVSGNFVILEANFENPADDPFHCPPATTQVHLQRDELTHQLKVFFYDFHVQEFYAQE